MSLSRIYRDNDTVESNDYHSILQGADYKTREATLYYDAIVFRDGLSTMRRIYYIFKKRDDDFTFLELLSGFVLNHHEKFELPASFKDSNLYFCRFTPSDVRDTDFYKNDTVFARIAALMEV